MTGRFVVFNITAIALVALAASAGLLDSAVTGPARWGVLALTLNLGAGLAATLFKRFHLARFFTGQATALALAGTLYGVIAALVNLAPGAEGDNMRLIAQGVGLSVWSTFVGVVSYLWLRAGLAIYGRKEE